MTNQQPARVRFAPSPTGYLHLGGLRTALFNWLYARHTGGQFILRIEDTDQNRYNPESLDDIMRGLRWLGLDWDEGPDIGGPYGPYVQTERQALYHDYIEKLIASGHAYKCYVTSEELDAMREEQRAKGQPMGYDRRHRWLTDEQRAELEATGRSHVVRFAAPLEGVTRVHDLIRGDIEIESASILDPVLIKSDGIPTYHFANVIDDHFMEITHILRADEWISSAPLHKQLYDAFGWEMPALAHLPVILDPSGKGKMSKRKKIVDGKEYLALTHEFIEAGYLPDAMFNFLTNVGWNFDPEREIFARAEVIERFNDISSINPKPAALPYDKLEWLNGVYIRAMSTTELHQQLVPFLAKQLDLDEAELAHSETLSELVPHIQERLKLLTDAAPFIDWAFQTADQITYPEPSAFIGRKMDAAGTVAVLEAGITLIDGLSAFTVTALEKAFRDKSEAMQVKVGPFLTPFRVALTGKTVAPPLFESMVAIGREETLTRLRNGLRVLKSYAATPVPAA
ncbi:MAG: glutamate--tRNA ligase [Caldilineaceae bacterium]|nr:glutamate--tRNA ligase [Caldilineaceae bacterium]